MDGSTAGYATWREEYVKDDPRSNSTRSVLESPHETPHDIQIDPLQDIIRESQKTLWQLQENAPGPLIDVNFLPRIDLGDASRDTIQVSDDGLLSNFNFSGPTAAPPNFWLY